MKKRDDERVPVSLPELYGTQNKKLSTSACIVAAVLLLSCFFLVLALLGKSDGYVEVALPESEGEEWRGAFDTREIYEACLEQSVSLGVGRGEYMSGAVISEDGWIATDGSALDTLPRGRICVRLFDGNEYGVESILRDDSTSAALLKISAEGLNASKLCEDALQSGEDVMAVSLGREVFKGSAVSIADGLRLDVSGGSECRGAPVFDSKGHFVGIYREGYSCSAEDIRLLYGKLEKK